MSSLNTTPTCLLYAKYYRDNALLLKSYPTYLIFSEHNIPGMLVSDNGPQYSSATFAKFAKEWKFTHITSSPHHTEGNGFAESMMMIVKQILQWAKYSGCDPYLALLTNRAKPLDSKIVSLAELQSILPSCLKNTSRDADDTQQLCRQAGQDIAVA